LQDLPNCISQGRDPRNNLKTLQAGKEFSLRYAGIKSVAGSLAGREGKKGKREDTWAFNFPLENTRHCIIQGKERRRRGAFSIQLTGLSFYPLPSERKKRTKELS